MKNHYICTFNSPRNPRTTDSKISMNNLPFIVYKHAFEIFKFSHLESLDTSFATPWPTSHIREGNCHEYVLRILSKRHVLCRTKVNILLCKGGFLSYHKCHLKPNFLQNFIPKLTDWRNRKNILRGD